MVHVKGDKAYEDDDTTEIPSATRILEDIRNGHNSLLEPKFDPEAKFENKLTSNDEIEELINKEGDARWPEKLYTLDDELIPEEFRADAESPSNISIQRKLLVIKVEKDDDGELIYHQYTEEAGKLVPADAEGKPLAEDAEPAEWDPKASHTRGMKRHEGNRHWIEINDFVFVGKKEDIDEAKEDSGIKEITNKTEKDSTFTHELQHFRNSVKMSEIFKDKNPHVSIKDYYRLCYLDEVSATLAAVIKDKDKPEAEQSEITKKILNELSGTFPDLATTDGRKELLQTVMKYWNKNIAKLYASSAENNDQFRKQLNDYVETNPWGSNIADGSEDYKEAVKGMLGNVEGADFSAAALDEDMPDPVKEHEEILKDGVSVSDGENFLDEMEDKADKLCEERAQYGFNEEFEHQYHEHPEIEYTKTPFTFESQRGNPFDNEEAKFYKEFFENICKTNNEKEDKEYDLEYVEKSSRRRYEVDLVRKSGGRIDNTTNIKIDSDKKVIMTATNADGTPTVSDQDRFNDLAELAAKKGGNKIKFGNIRNPEFKARLYLACITHKPPVAMENAPDLDSLRESASKETISQIENAQRINKLRETLESEKASGKDRDTALSNLDTYREDISNGMDFAKWYESNKKELLKELVNAKDGDKNLFEGVTNDRGELVNVKLAEGVDKEADKEAVKNALEKFDKKRRSDYIKFLSEGSKDYDHDKKDSSGKPVKFYQQIKEAKGPR